MNHEEITDKRITGPKVVSFILRPNHYLLRDMVNQDAISVQTHILVYSIPVSNMEYSDALLACISEVESEFYALLETLDVSGGYMAVDCSGVTTRYPSKEVMNHPIPMYELVASNKEFTTKTLGCCVTYSHPAFGSHCLACAIIGDTECPSLVNLLDRFR